MLCEDASGHQVELALRRWPRKLQPKLPEDKLHLLPLTNKKSDSVTAQHFGVRCQWNHFKPGILSQHHINRCKSGLLYCDYWRLHVQLLYIWCSPPQESGLKYSYIGGARLKRGGESYVRNVRTVNIYIITSICLSKDKLIYLCNKQLSTIIHYVDKLCNLLKCSVPI